MYTMSRLYFEILTCITSFAYKIFMMLSVSVSVHILQTVFSSYYSIRTRKNCYYPKFFIAVQNCSIVKYVK